MAPTDHRLRDVKRPTKQEPAVLEELGAIDTSSLDELDGIRREQVRLEGFRQKAEELRAQVEEPVWQKVVEDYGQRASQLADQAGPLRAKVAAEYAKLRTVRDRVSAVADTARLAKQELEFRHAVGEIGDDELADNLPGPDDTLERCRGDSGGHRRPEGPVRRGDRLGVRARGPGRAARVSGPRASRTRR